MEVEEVEGEGEETVVEGADVLLGSIVDYCGIVEAVGSRFSSQVFWSRIHMVRGPKQLGCAFRYSSHVGSAGRP